jgi:signal transduction histidine kinase
MATTIQGTKAYLVPAGTSRHISLGLLLYIILNSACLAAQPAQRVFLSGDTAGLLSHPDLVGRYTAGDSAVLVPDARFSAQIFALIWNPPFVQSSWAVALGCLSIGILVGILARAPQRRRMQRAKGSMGIVLEERNRIAQECHDTLMAGFSAISWQLEATMNLFRDSNEVQSPAAKSCELARSMVLLCQAEARRIIYDLRETEEVTSSLSKALLRMLEENHHSAGSSLHFDMEGEEVSLSPGSVHHLARIAQEAVRNALRHAQARSIYIRLIYEADLLRLLVRDDGRGFQLDEAAARTGHFGIAVMQERARKMGGTLQLHSGSSGTEVEATVPYDAIYLTRNTRGDVKEKEVVQWIGL